MSSTEALKRWLAATLPRILSQVCRDPNSACYGCFDRHWWHYKVRDFPSLILQQGGYALWIASQIFTEHQEAFAKLADASAHFWNARAVRRGAFEEYYPWEQGYPPLAFSTLAIMKLVADGVVDPQNVEPGSRVAARQLLTRFERQAANQQIAGLAALAWLRRSFPRLVPDVEFDRLRDRSLALQHAEGWFEEYGGPDLGYLSVTMDCLWDLFDATGDDSYVRSAERALHFMHSLVAVTGDSIGMHNSRNTDYILPYGIARFVVEDHPARDVATTLLEQVYEHIDAPHHFVHAIDDRYLCHYAGHSLLRGAFILQNVMMTATPTPAHGPEKLYEGSGHYLRYDDTNSILSLRKGGVLTLQRGAARASDFGWIVLADGRAYVNHWWSPHWRWSRDGDSFTITGHLVPHHEHISTPLKHLLLRAASWTLGRQLISGLKAKVIFESTLSPFVFTRTVAFTQDGARITDEIAGLPEGATVMPAPRASKRHVASADSFHGEDLDLLTGFARDCTIRHDQGVFTATVSYTPCG